MLDITVKLDQDVLSPLRRSPDEFANECVSRLPSKLYKRGEISQEEAVQVAGLDRTDFCLQSPRRRKCLCLSTSLILKENSNMAESAVVNADVTIQSRPLFRFRHTLWYCRTHNKMLAGEFRSLKRANFTYSSQKAKKSYKLVGWLSLAWPLLT